MEYINIVQNVGGVIFALGFWVMCYKLEKVVNGLKG